MATKWPRLSRGAFSAAESDQLVSAFLTQQGACSSYALYDDAWIPQTFALALSNVTSRPRNAKAKYTACADLSGAADWAVVRALEAFGFSPADIGRVSFVLLHEFHGNSGFFDTHVDTLPGDPSGRAWAINVMLSSRGRDYIGGELTMGGRSVDTRKGDAYIYPSSLPHAVSEVTAGTRHTFVIALTEPTPFESSWDAYWNAAERRLLALLQEQQGSSSSSTIAASSTEPLLVPKLHVIHAELLSALGRPQKDVDAAHCRAYYAAMGNGRMGRGRLAERFLVEGLEEAKRQRHHRGGADGGTTAAHLMSIAQCLAPADMWNAWKSAAWFNNNIIRPV